MQDVVTAPTVRVDVVRGVGPGFSPSVTGIRSAARPGASPSAGARDETDSRSAGLWSGCDADFVGRVDSGPLVSGRSRHDTEAWAE